MGKWYQGRRGAYFLLLLGIGLLIVYGALEWRLPTADRLASASGRVAWSYTSRGALYFTLDGEARRFVLLEKGDVDGRLRAAVRDATMLYPVTVRFDPLQTSRPGFLPGFFYIAFGVSVGGKDVTSFDDVRRAHRLDNLIALAMGLVFAAVGGRRLYSLRGVAEPAPAPPRRRRRSGPGAR
jgi:hypothetical protein